MPMCVPDAIWANQSIKINEVKSSREVQIFLNDRNWHLKMIWILLWFISDWVTLHKYK